MLPTLDDLTKSETVLCALLVHTEGVIEDVGSSAIQVLSLSLCLCQSPFAPTVACTQCGEVAETKTKNKNGCSK